MSSLRSREGISGMNRITNHSLFQLTALRFRIFFREPEAVFWIFIFPILLSIGLSIAFRNRPAEILQVAGTTEQVTASLNTDRGLHAVIINESDGKHALATGAILLLAIQKPDGVIFEFDNTNPDARMASIIADRALQHAAGQKDVVQLKDLQIHETGSRYIDFVIPGLLGMNLMS